MARGRKKATTDITTYTNELNKLVMLEQELLKELDSCRAEIKRYKELITQEEIKEIKSIMEEKNISFEELKSMLDTRNQATTPEEEITGE